MKFSTTTLLVGGAGLLYLSGPRTLVQPSSTARSAAAFGGLGMLLLAAYRKNSKVGLALGGVVAAAAIGSRLRSGRAFVGAAEHPGLGPSLAVQEAAWRSQPNAEKMYPWDQIFSQPTVAGVAYPSGTRDDYPGFMVGVDGVPVPGPIPYAPAGSAPMPMPGQYDAYPGAGSAYPGASSGGRGNSSGGNPTRTSTEVRSPTSTSTEVRSPTSTSTEVRSPTSTSTEAFTADNFTATVTGGAGAGATTSVNIYFTPPDHMADERGHTSNVGVTQVRGEQPQEEYPEYPQLGYYPPPYLGR